MVHRALVLAALVSALTPGCAEMALRQKERQMELVARDWSMTIRASQVVPVYPLTQDLLPGDVFLVQSPIAEQSRRYRDRGFLPTDLHIARLGADGYGDFYKYYETPPGAGTTLVLPRDWRVGPPKGSISEQTLGAGVWHSFPRVGFPSYTFEVSNRGGLSAALPVQGIPVALSATGAARATGSVTIADSISYGVDAETLYASLRTHLQTAAAREGLRPPKGQTWYLRVVTRVFAAKRFDIVLTSTSTEGGGLDVGAPKTVADTAPPAPLALPDHHGDATPEMKKIVTDDLAVQASRRDAAAKRAEAQKNGQGLQGGLTVEAINQQLRALEADSAAKEAGGAGLGAGAARLAPGASLRATFASGRTVGFRETFTEPIVVGYHGFDVALDSAGNVGPIVPTFAVLDQSANIPPPTALTTEDSAYIALLDLLDAVQRAHPGALNSTFAAAAAKDKNLRAAYEAEFRARPDPVAAWRRATRTWMDTAGPGSDRRSLVRDWLADAIRESGLRLSAPPPPPPPTPPTGTTGPAAQPG